ncbi:MAG: CXXX repeat peptide modification system protein [Planctomycetia bacterium]|nr:CXXX repeat peptide modification system protein [Planctomycetia bacterium]
MSAEKKVVGTVTPQQRDEIQGLFERRNSLKELFMIVDPKNTALYERVVADMSETQKKFDQWWSDRAKEYQWESAENGNWEIDFQTCEIFLVNHPCANCH